ncbi:MAG: hypothetical protein KDB22_10765, partial [Planctomycetales bacterium]|nr:hypothetical protein [Planctomycetales bacterium]
MRKCAGAESRTQGAQDRWALWTGDTGSRTQHLVATGSRTQHLVAGKASTNLGGHWGIADTAVGTVRNRGWALRNRGHSTWYCGGH